MLTTKRCLSKSFRVLGLLTFDVWFIALTVLIWAEPYCLCHNMFQTPSGDEINDDDDDDDKIRKRVHNTNITVVRLAVD
jgi:hypothetical protein